jgi:hypothetical protein
VGLRHWFLLHIKRRFDKMNGILEKYNVLSPYAQEKDLG